MPRKQDGGKTLIDDKPVKKHSKEQSDAMTPDEKKGRSTTSGKGEQLTDDSNTLSGGRPTVAALGVLQKGRLWLPQEILKPLRLDTSSVITCVYYPILEPAIRPDNSAEHYERAQQLPDLVLTPFPFRYWDRIVGMSITLRHQPNSMDAVAEELSKDNWTILSMECTRSGHRYATWQLVCALEESSEPIELKESALFILDKRGTRDRVNSQWEKEVMKWYSDTIIAKANATAENIKVNCMDKLCASGPGLSQIIVRPMSTLCYHLAVTKLRRSGFSLETVTDLSEGTRLSTKTSEYRRALFKPFSIYLRDDGGIDGGTSFKQLCSALSEEHKRMGTFMPALVFAELNLEELYVRAAFIPDGIRRAFGKATFHYSLSGENSSRGLLHKVLRQLKDRVDIWLIKNSCSLHGPLGETGKVELMFLHIEALKYLEKVILGCKSATQEEIDKAVESYFESFSKFLHCAIEGMEAD